MRRVFATILFSLSMSLTGCNDPVYFAGPRTLTSMDTELFVLPVRLPTATEMTELMREQQRLGLPQAVPWAKAIDFDIEVAWSITNLESQEITAQLTLNGGSEFGDYQPMLFVDPTAPPDEQVVPPPLAGGTPLTLAANETRTGLFREDEIAEAAIDLEAIVRYPPPDAGLSTPFQVITHRSSISTIGLEGIPPRNITPAMVRYQVAVAASGQASVDFSVRVRNHNGKLARLGAPNLYVSTAAMLPPVVIPMAAP